MTIFRRVKGSGAIVASVLVLAALLAPPARAEEKSAVLPRSAAATPPRPAPTGHVAEASWPADFRKMFDAAEKGVPVLDEKAKARFKALPTHAQELFFAAAKAGTLSGGTHLATLLALDIDDRKVELVLSDNCFLCHSNPDLPDEILFRKREKTDPLRHLDIREVVADVHVRGGLMCAGCHGGKPTDLEMSADIGKRWPSSEVRKKDRSWIPEFCARCHSSSEFMRAYNPSLPVDQLLKYKTSKHGQLLLEKKDAKAAQCVSCHGVHGIRPPDSTNSLVYRENIPATCGKCHADAAYMDGLHEGRRQDAAPDEPARAVQEERPRARAPRQARRRRARRATAATATTRRCRRRSPSSRRSAATATPRTGASSTAARTRRRSRSTAGPSARPATASTTSRGRRTRCSRTTRRASATTATRSTDEPKCDETARYFHTSIVGLAESHEKLNHDVDRLLERGFDVDELRFQSSAVNDALRKTRLGIHTFDRSDFTRNADATGQALDGLKKGVENVWKEYRFRRNGLLLATVLISLFGVLLYLKISRWTGDEQALQGQGSPRSHGGVVRGRHRRLPRAARVDGAQAFGRYGFFRAGALDDLRARPLHYAGHAACEDCHSTSSPRCGKHGAHRVRGVPRPAHDARAARRPASPAKPDAPTLCIALPLREPVEAQELPAGRRGGATAPRGRVSRVTSLTRRRCRDGGAAMNPDRRQFLRHPASSWCCPPPRRSRGRRSSPGSPRRRRTTG